MLTIKRYFFSFIFITLFVSLKAQVSIAYMPSVNGQTLNGLSFAKIMNYSGYDLKAELTIKVKELRQGQVVTVKVPEFILIKGVNEMNRTSFSKSLLIFGQSEAGRILNQTQRFQEGEYEYCFELNAYNVKNTQLFGYFENCFTQIIEPPTPLLLIDPADDDKICNKRPGFTWQLPMPLNPEFRYRVILSTIGEFQTPAEAIANNIPVFIQANLSSNILLFPLSAQDLVEGKRYAWQVIAYSNKTIIQKSEIWTFSIACDKTEEKKDNDSYREVKSTDDGESFIAVQSLRFSFKNQYTEGMLHYEIQSLSKPDKAIKKLPDLKMKPGVNYYEIDLSKYRFFKKGDQYLLIIIGADNRKYTLKFVYEE